MQAVLFAASSAGLPSCDRGRRGVVIGCIDVHLSRAKRRCIPGSGIVGLDERIGLRMLLLPPALIHVRAFSGRSKAAIWIFCYSLTTGVAALPASSQKHRTLPVRHWQHHSNAAASCDLPRKCSVLPVRGFGHQLVLQHPSCNTCDLSVVLQSTRRRAAVRNQIKPGWTGPIYWLR
jgi:hypothetical protein